MIAKVMEKPAVVLTLQGVAIPVLVFVPVAPGIAFVQASAWEYQRGDDVVVVFLPAGVVFAQDALHRHLGFHILEQGIAMATQATGAVIPL